MANDTLSKEDVVKTVAETVKAYMDEQKKNEVKSKFTPGVGETTVQVVTDEADQKFANMGEYLQAVRKAGPEGVHIREPRLKRCIEGALHPVTKAPTGMGETVPSDGAFLVAQEFIPTLLIQDELFINRYCAERQFAFLFNATPTTMRTWCKRWINYLFSYSC